MKHDHSQMDETEPSPGAPRNVPPPFPAATALPEGPGRTVAGLRLGLLGKCLGILALILLLQIPLLMIRSLGEEREGRRNEAVSQIGQRWGGSQIVAGPVLVVPFIHEVTTIENTGSGTRQLRRPVRANAYFLPEELQMKGVLEPETRRLGIYGTVVYSARLSLEGRFAKPEWKQFGVVPTEILWSDARVMVCVSDVNGLREAPDWTWQGDRQAWQPGSRWNEMKTGLHTPVKGVGPGNDGASFAMSFTLNGSDEFACVPTGRTSVLELRSPWADPGFEGSYLPSRRAVGPEGFEAEWRLSHLARILPQQWADCDADTPDWGDLGRCKAAVSLAHAVDSYRTMDRALKHGVLFLALVFTAFMLFDLGGLRGLSFLHYALVGGALCLFYLSLLALSEFTGFTFAYLVSAAASTLLITLYSVAILRSGARALLILAGLCGVYGYLYFVLQMQDYALLAGTAALFASLASIMWVTRKLGSTQAAPLGEK